MGLTKTMYALFLFLLFASSGYAGWQGPVEVVTGSWGSSPGQFYFSSGDTTDSFPREIGIDSQGRLFVNDKSNARIQVFSSSGSIVSIINAPQGVNISAGWPYNIYVHPDGSLVASQEGPQKYFYDVSGSLVKKVEVYGDAFPTVQGYYFEVERTQYDLYSLAGQFIKTSTLKPLELGELNEEDLGRKRYKTTVKYDDATYVIISDRTYEGFSRDKYKAIYGINPSRVEKYSLCGKLIGSLMMPKKTIYKSAEIAGQEQYILTHDEYGSPVVDINGNVYAWKRTPSKYSILKWTWVDDPNVPTGPDAPSSLKVATSTNGLYISWTASPQDPGCVTGYEISRATSVGGSGTTVGTTTPGKVTFNDSTAASGTTYYYKVRAVSGSEYSPYTSEVSGRKP